MLERTRIILQIYFSVDISGYWYAANEDIIHRAVSTRSAGISKIEREKIISEGKGLIYKDPAHNLTSVYERTLCVSTGNTHTHLDTQTHT